MPKIYKIETGDTFAIISRKQYGEESQAQNIASANPGVFEPLQVGANVSIPDQQGVEKFVIPNQPANSENEVSIVIDNKRIRFWSQVSFTRAIDSFDTFSFSAPFDSDDPIFRDIFKPFSYKQVSVAVGGIQQYEGTTIGIQPFIIDNRAKVEVSSYSRPGVLGDCTAPLGLFSEENVSTELQFEGQTIREIAEYFCAPFGLDVLFGKGTGFGFAGPSSAFAFRFNEPSNQSFERVSINPTKKILPFLVDLAKQRGLVIASGGGGQLLFQKSVGAGSPVAAFRQGESPLESVTPNFKPQEYYSHLTGVQPVSIGSNDFAGSQYVVKNKLLEGVLRPLTKQITDSTGALITESTIAEYSRMLANSVGYSIEVATWRDPQGDLWIPNTTVKLTAPGAMIYNEYEFLIRGVTFSATNDSKTAVINLVLPESFSGETPKVMPWE